MAKLIETDNNICVYELIDGDLRLLVTNFGAAIFSVEMKEENGEYQLLTLSCDSIADFMKNGAFFGATVGRTVNRIGKGKFAINGKEYQLPLNDGKNSAHGGNSSFAHRAWDTEVLENGAVRFTLTSPDGDEGYPGEIKAAVTYTLSNGTIHIDHEVVSDADTIVNFTNHAYWCIGGPQQKIYDQKLMINGKEYLETDDALIPTGQILAVKGTPFDFTEPTAIGVRIFDDHPSLNVNRGYDISFVRAQREPGIAARLQDPASGRVMEVYSSYPDIHIYTGNFLDGVKGKNGQLYEKHDAICLESSLFPDAINHPHFGRIILRKGEKYQEFIEFKFRYEN